MIKLYVTEIVLYNIFSNGSTNCQMVQHNKLSIHLGKDKTKCILLSREKNRRIPYNIVGYLGNPRQ